MPDYGMATSNGTWRDGVDFETVVAGVAAAGFSWIEPRPGKGFGGTDDVAAMRRVLDHHGVHAKTIHPPIGQNNLASPDEDVRRASVAEISECFAAFAGVGGFAAIVHPSGPGPDAPYDARIDAFRRSLDTLYARADALGICLACENLPGHRRPHPLARMEQLRALLDQYPPDVGICLDTGHSVLNGADPADEVKIAGDRLIAVHLCDTDGIEDRHWLPGRGIIDWACLHAALVEIGFDGARTFEVRAEDGGPVALGRRLRRIADAWNAAQF